MNKEMTHVNVDICYFHIKNNKLLPPNSNSSAQREKTDVDDSLLSCLDGF